MSQNPNSTSLPIPTYQNTPISSPTSSNGGGSAALSSPPLITSARDDFDPKLIDMQLQRALSSLSLYDPDKIDLAGLSPQSQVRKLAHLTKELSQCHASLPPDQPDAEGIVNNMALPLYPLGRYYFAPFDPEQLGVVEPDNARVELLILARQAESCERWHDMSLMMRRLAILTQGKFSREERNLFAIAHKHVLMPHRQALRVLSQNYVHPATLRLSQDYRKHIEYELKTFCQSLAEFICTHLLDKSLELGDHRVFFLKLVGDLYRYIAELNPIRDNDACRLCRSYYHDAALLAERCMTITSPIRLGLLLNYAVAAFELFRDYKTACEMTKCAFDKAIQRLDELDEEDFRDTTLIMQLMRDNLALWVAMQHHHIPPSLQFPPAYDIQKVFVAHNFDDGGSLAVNDPNSHLKEPKPHLTDAKPIYKQAGHAQTHAYVQAQVQAHTQAHAQAQAQAQGQPLPATAGQSMGNVQLVPIAQPTVTINPTMTTGLPAATAPPPQGHVPSQAQSQAQAQYLQQMQGQRR